MNVAAALAACATPADHYRLQMRLENLLTPAEAFALDDQVEALPEGARDWVRRLAQMARRIRPQAEPYRHHALAETVSLYEGEGPAGAPRSLVVCFTGIGERMMVPTAAFLQGLPAARCDVVLLRDTARAAFLCGVPGYADDLPGLAARLEQDIPAGRHADRRCVGASSGAAAALAFGSIFGASVALGLGGMQPVAMRLPRAPEGLDRRAFARVLNAASGTRFICAYGEAFQRDVVRGALLAMTIPRCRTLPVAGVDMHGVVAGLVREDALCRFLDEVLLGDTAPAAGAWQPRPAALTPSGPDSPE
jgi:hypothetical protein